MKLPTSWFQSYPTHIIFGSYLLLAGIFFYPFFLHKTLLVPDNILHIVPAYSFWKTEILQGRLPLWNPHIFAGTPFLADPSHSVFSPFNVIFLGFNSLFVALNLQIILLITLGSFGAYLLARSLNLPIFPSFMAGLFFGFSGSVFETAGDLNALTSVAFIPWVLWACIQDLVHKRNKFPLKFAFVLGLHLVSGHTQYAYYTLLVIVIGYSIWLLNQYRQNYRSMVSSWMFLGLGIITAFGLAAIQLLPAFELTQLSARNLVEPSQMLTVESLPRLLISNVYGARNQGTSWGPNSLEESGLANVTGFVSLVGVGLAVVGLRLRQKLPRFLLVSSLFALILALGTQTPVFELARHLIPGFRLFRSLDRILIMYTLGMSLAAASALAYAKNTSHLNLKKIYQILILLTVGLLIGIVVNPAIISDSFIHVYEGVKGVSLNEAGGYSKDKLEAISQLMLKSAGIVLVGLSGLVVVVDYLQTKRLWLMILALMLIGVELFVSIRNNFRFVPIEKLEAQSPLVATTPRNDFQSRMVSVGDIEPYIGIWTYFNHLNAMPPFSKGSVDQSEMTTFDRLETELELIPTNTHQVYGLKSATGYAALIPQAYRDYVGSSKVNSLDFTTSKNPRLNQFSVKTILASRDFGTNYGGFGDYPIKAISDSGMVVENPNFKPRFDWVTQSGLQETPLITEFQETSNSIDFVFIASESGKLIIRDLDYPGWVAKINNQPVKLERYEAIFKQLPIQAGVYKIHLQFFPKSVLIGGLITLGTLLIVIALVIYRKLPNFRIFD